MTCDDLATTGQPVTGLLILSGIALITGLLLILSTNPKRARTAVLAITLLVAADVIAGSAASNLAQAASPACGHASGSDGLIIEPSPAAAPLPDPGTAASPLDIGQISSNMGIAPGIGAGLITGRIVNRGPETIFVAEITVEIASVTKATGAVQGTCDATDYSLNNPIMPIGRTLQSGESAVFSGASIGFRDKPVNQDACQAAVVGLEYFSS